jgi:hypothetical protein
MLAATVGSLGPVTGAESERERDKRRYQRLLFDGVAERYQAVRPGYPAHLVESVITIPLRLARRAGPHGPARRNDLARTLERLEARALHKRQHEPHLGMAETVVTALRARINDKGCLPSAYASLSISSPKSAMSLRVPPRAVTKRLSTSWVETSPLSI